MVPKYSGYLKLFFGVGTTSHHLIFRNMEITFWNNGRRLLVRRTRAL